MCVYIYLFGYTHTHCYACKYILLVPVGSFAHDTTITTRFGRWWLGWVPTGQQTPLSAGDGLLLLFWGSHCYEGLQDQNGSKGRIKKPDGDAEHYDPSLFTGKGTGEATGDQ